MFSAVVKLDAKRLGHVLFDVFDIFEADRQANQAIADAKPFTLLDRQARMRRRRRMGDQTLGVAQVVGDMNAKI